MASTCYINMARKGRSRDKKRQIFSVDGSIDGMLEEHYIHLNAMKVGSSGFIEF